MSTDKEIDHFKEGQKACRTYFTSQAFAGFTTKITAELASKLYLPPVENSLMMVSTPLPKPRQKWLAGFKKEQVAILAEQAVRCKTCNQLLPKEPKKE